MDDRVNPLDAYLDGLHAARAELLVERAHLNDQLTVNSARLAGIEAQFVFLKLEDIEAAPVTIEQEIAAMEPLTNSVAVPATEAGEGPSTPSPAPIAETSAIPAGKGEAVVATGGLPGDRPKTLAERVAEFVNAHPHEFTAREVADHLPELNRNSVLAACSRDKLPVRKVTEEEAKERARAAAPEPAPAVVPPAPVKHAKGTKFRLRAANGKYLHMSCTTLTSDRSYAWSGTEDKLLAVRQRFEIARDLAEEVIVVVPQPQVAA